MADYYQIWQGAIILNPNNHLLLVQKGDSGWSSAGGELSVDEHYDESLKNTIKHKLGITDLKVIKPFHIQTFQAGQSHTLTFKEPHYGVWFLCRTAQTEVKLSSDYDEYQWISKESDLSAIQWLHPLSKVLVERVLKGE
jgi:hypothetical protein